MHPPSTSLHFLTSHQHRLGYALPSGGEIEPCAILDQWFYPLPLHIRGGCGRFSRPFSAAGFPLLPVFVLSLASSFLCCVCCVCCVWPQNKPLLPRCHRLTPPKPRFDYFEVQSLRKPSREQLQSFAPLKASANWVDSRCWCQRDSSFVASCLFLTLVGLGRHRVIYFTAAWNQPSQPENKQMRLEHAAIGLQPISSG